MIVEGISVFLEDLTEFCTSRLQILFAQLQVDKKDCAAESCLNDFANLSGFLNPINTAYKRTQYLEDWCCN